MLIDGKSLEKGSRLESDVCILGCGVAGTVIANELKGKFNNICVIESGNENFDPEVQALYEPSSQHKTFFNPHYSRLRMLGGSSNHWENNTSPFDAIDFEKRDWVKDSGWPIQYADISPYYKKAAEYCGAGSQGYAPQTWEKNLGEQSITHDSQTIDTGISIFSSPPVRFFASYGDALINDTALKVYKNCNVVDLAFDEASEEVNGVLFETQPGNRFYISAKLVILCFGGIENARMLLHFNKSKNNRLGNTHDNVGRYFMDHPVVEAAHFFPNDQSIYKFYQDSHADGKNIVAYLKLNDQAIRKHGLNNLRLPLIPKDNFYLSDGVSSFHILKNAASEGEAPDHFGTHVVNFIKDIDMIAEGISRQKFKTKLFDDAEEIEGFMVYMMMEQTPHRDNRIKLSANKDRFGIPKIEIDWTLTDSDKENLWKALEVLAQDVGERSLGRLKILKEREQRMWREGIGFGHHHMGTTKMAANEKEGVVDKNQKVFGTKNLYVAGSSVFPTGGHVPPTLTITATSIRLAQHIEKEHI